MKVLNLILIVQQKKNKKLVNNWNKIMILKYYRLTIPLRINLIKIICQQFLLWKILLNLRNQDKKFKSKEFKKFKIIMNLYEIILKFQIKVQII